MNYTNIKNKKIRTLYMNMWGNKSIITDGVVDKTIVTNAKNNTKKYSENSYSLVGDDKEATLSSFFNIRNKEMFHNKFKMICGGAGHEYNRITTLHSSSLCALLFFYNVTKDNRLNIVLNGKSATFDKSFFEYKSPVINKQNPSSMDVVLIGKDSNEEPIVLFLESKFSEYFTSTSKRLKSIKSDYCTNEFSKPFYRDFWMEIGTRIENGRNEKCIALSSTEEYYITGIKQMISHYVGIRNDLNNEFCENAEDMAAIQELIQKGAKVYLGEIVFDKIIGDLNLTDGMNCLRSYSQKYEALAAKMRTEIQNDGISNRFEVLEEELRYSVVFSDYMGIEDTIRFFYSI